MTRATRPQPTALPPVSRKARSGRLRRVFEAIDPEPIIAVLEELATPARRRRLLQVFGARLDSVTLLMDAPHDPHNGAAMMRSCDAFGVGRVHVVERTEPFAASNAVAKGAERWVDVVTHATVADAVAALRDGGYRLIATHPEGALEPEALARVPRLALVMGNEHDGICEELQAACAERVRVPMRGFVESLNVSVSAAILLSHATAGRPGDLPVLALRRWYARGLTVSIPKARQILAAHGIELPTGEPSRSSIQPTNSPAGSSEACR